MEPTAAPLACVKCRSQRIKCDRKQPVCSRCEKFNHTCAYPARNTATAWLEYTQALEAGIAALEQEISEVDANDRFADGLGNIQIEGDQTMPDCLAHPSPLGSSSTGLIEDLFANAQSRNESNVQGIMNDLIKVPLSGVTSQTPLVTQDGVLKLLIQGAACSVPDLRPARSNYLLMLPGQAVSERVMAKYCESILPTLPFATPDEVQNHLHRAFQTHDPFSIFVTASALASTAVSVSPDSTDKALALYLAGLAALEASFTTLMDDEALRLLEAAIVLGQFAELTESKFSDSWVLAGIAARITVDLGLHELCNTDRERRLFQSACILDAQAATSRGLPPGIPTECSTRPREKA